MIAIIIDAAPRRAISQLTIDSCIDDIGDELSKIYSFLTDCQQPAALVAFVQLRRNRAAAHFKIINAIWECCAANWCSFVNLYFMFFFSNIDIWFVAKTLKKKTAISCKFLYRARDRSPVWASRRSSASQDFFSFFNYFEVGKCAIIDSTSSGDIKSSQKKVNCKTNWKQLTLTMVDRSRSWWSLILKYLRLLPIKLIRLRKTIASFVFVLFYFVLCESNFFILILLFILDCYIFCNFEMIHYIK